MPETVRGVLQAKSSNNNENGEEETFQPGTSPPTQFEGSHTHNNLTSFSFKDIDDKLENHNLHEKNENNSNNHLTSQEDLQISTTADKDVDLMLEDGERLHWTTAVSPESASTTETKKAAFAGVPLKSSATKKKMPSTMPPSLLEPKRFFSNRHFKLPPPLQRSTPSATTTTTTSSDPISKDNDPPSPNDDHHHLHIEKKIIESENNISTSINSIKDEDKEETYTWNNAPTVTESAAESAAAAADTQNLSDASSISNNNNTELYNTTPNAYEFLYYDPAAALAFLDSQANFTKSQMEAAQKTLLEYSMNATKQLDSAQKALLEYSNSMFAPVMVNTANNRSGSSGSNARQMYNNNKQRPLLSVEELEAYLRLNGYVRRDEVLGASSSFSSSTPIVGLPGSQYGRGRGRVNMKQESRVGGFQAVGVTKDDDPSSSSVPGTSQNYLSTMDESKQPQQQQVKGRVAFPQPSILSYAKLKWGSTAAASMLGLIGGISIVPNLWLLGLVFGGLYGYETSKRLAEQPPSNPLSHLVVYLGRALTKYYLQVYDFGAGMWFMYKTGQLSYEYWKRYAALDQQFAIQDKIDAWNARFQKGKENFDKWEQENEVGRKILAGLRTAWLVEENRLKATSRKKESKYRVVQWCYDGSSYVRNRIKAMYAKRGKAIQELQELAKGMQQELTDPSRWKEAIRPRLVAGLAALTFVNLTGILFSVSPLLLGGVAVMLGGVVWPTWFSEWLGRVGMFFEETRAVGRGEQLFRDTFGETKLAQALSRSTTSSSGKGAIRGDVPNLLAWPLRDKKSKERYSFYRRQDGSKRWYRAGGNPWDTKAFDLSNMFGQKKKDDVKPWWALKKKEDDKPRWSLN